MSAGGTEAEEPVRAGGWEDASAGETVVVETASSIGELIASLSRPLEAVGSTGTTDGC